jgi:hypothetical protein
VNKMVETVYRLTVLWLLLGILSGVSDAEDVARAIWFVEISVGVAVLICGGIWLIWLIYCRWGKDIAWRDLCHPLRRRAEKDRESRSDPPPGG